ncbi:MAG: Sua5/YciO/YrdC/YwlC family protein [Bdellovibrio sp.]|nr:Sua5/YciO/YrdC/YwlC family protein [Bdellovibrio sp.]
MNIYIYPTDTVWGIGASIYDFQAHLRIGEIKKTPADKPVSILMPTLKDVQEYFNLPETTNFVLLKEMFKLEVTLGFPLQWMQKEIPSYIFSGSSWVGVRCLEPASMPSIKCLMKEVSGPITSTSLNYSGEAPITSEVLAREFAKKIENCTFIPPLPNDPPMSGQSSCLLCFDDQGASKLIRSGRFVKRLQDCAKRLF